MVQPKPYDLKGIEAWRTFKRANKAIWSGPNHWTFNLGPLIISLLFLIFCIWFSYFLHSLCNSSFLCIFFYSSYLHYLSSLDFLSPINQFLSSTTEVSRLLSLLGPVSLIDRDNRDRYIGRIEKSGPEMTSN